METSLAPIDEFDFWTNIWSRGSWHLASGAREDPRWVSSKALHATLLLSTCCLEWRDECSLLGGLSLPLGQTQWKVYLLQEGGWRFLGCTFFLCNGWGQGCWLYYERVSLTTCLLSWSIILKWEMLAQGWLLEMLCMWTVLLTWLFNSFTLFFQTSAGFPYIRKAAIFFCTGPFVDYVLF